MASNIQNTGASTSTSSTGGTRSNVVRVFDIVLDANHPIFRDGGVPYDPTLLGMIFYGDKDLDVTSTSTFSLPKALPKVRGKYPVINELVKIETGPSPDIYTDIGGNNSFNYVYYGEVVPVHGNAVHNALPSQKDLASTTPTSEESVLASNGTPNQSQPNEVSLDNTGNYQPKDDVRNLQPYAGDVIREGRAGQTIRMGTTNKEGTNNWSDGDTFGDPVMILRVGQSENQQGSTVVEDVNGDASSIYMFANQKLNNIQLTTTNFESCQATYVEPIAPTVQLAVAPPPSEPTIPEEPTTPVDMRDPKPVEETSQPPVTSSFSDDELEDPVFAALAEVEEEGLIDIEDEEFEIAGTELSEEAQQNENNAGGDLDSGEGSGADSTAPETVGEYTAENRVGDYIEFKTSSEYENWKTNGNGKKDYPLKFIFKKQSGQKVGIVDPKSITDMIKQLGADGVNATNLPQIKYLSCHITATNFTNQHELMALFAYHKNQGSGWSRHGYNISVDSDGGCNYNVDLRKIGASYGSGNNVYSTTIQGFGPLENQNTINISWIGDIKRSMARTDLSKGEVNFTQKNTTAPDITAQQAYAYEKLIKYFVEAFPNIKVVGHNQITISGGYGKACPSWNNVRYCENIGIPDKNIHKLFPSDFTTSDWNNIIKPHLVNTGKNNDIQIIEQTANKYGGRYFQNFESYKNKKYNNTADYVYYLVRPQEAGTS